MTVMVSRAYPGILLPLVHVFIASCVVGWTLADQRRHGHGADVCGVASRCLRWFAGVLVDGREQKFSRLAANHENADYCEQDPDEPDE
jgi:hypothetical protein